MNNANLMIRELPVQERPREKMLNHGSVFLTNAELLALLIGTGNREKSAVDLSTDIIKSVGDLTDLGDITFEELVSIKGIGTAKACNILAALELNKRISSYSLRKKLKFSSPKDICKIFMDELRYEKKEHFLALLLNTKNELLSKEVISIGNLNSSIVHPREVYKMAVKKSAAYIIFIHNHPSGNPAPSKNDKMITERLVEVGKILGIEVLDHIIIGNNEYYSFKEKNIL